MRWFNQAKNGVCEQSQQEVRPDLSVEATSPKKNHPDIPIKATSKPQKVSNRKGWHQEIERVLNGEGGDCFGWYVHISPKKKLKSCIALYTKDTVSLMLNYASYIS
jgi:hypothetical protein